MISVYIIICLIALSNCQDTPKDPLDTECPILYTECNQQGQEYNLCGNSVLPLYMFKSVFVPIGQSITLTKKDDTYETFTENVDCLAFIIYGVSIGKVSTPECPTLYTECNQQGQEYNLCGNSVLPLYMFKSVFVPLGHSITLTKQDGLEVTFTENVDCLSFTIYGVSKDLIYTPECPTLYTECNQQGQEYNLCGNSILPLYMFKSAYVPNGFSITLTKEDNSEETFTESIDCLSFTIYGVSKSKLTTPQCPTLYTECDQKGQEYNLCGNSVLPLYMFKSVFVPKGYSITLTKQDDSTVTFTENIDCLSFIIYGISINKLTIQECPILYTQCNLKGKQYNLCGKSSLPLQMIKSIYIPKGQSVAVKKQNGSRVVLKKNIDCLSFRIYGISQCKKKK